MTVVERAKNLLSDPGGRIGLHDLVSEQAALAMARVGGEHLDFSGNWSQEAIAERLRHYESAVGDLLSLQVLLAYWGTDANGLTIALPLKRMAPQHEPGTGRRGWLGLRWYPSLLLLYAGGVAAVAAGRHTNLSLLMHATITDPRRVSRRILLRRGLVDEFEVMDEAFALVRQTRRHVSRSEYLFEYLEAVLDREVHLAEDYEEAFDRFEVLLALEHAQDMIDLPGRHIWGPPGRFRSKFAMGQEGSPFHQVVQEAQDQQDSWPPVRAGLFQGSIERFLRAASAYKDRANAAGWGW